MPEPDVREPCAANFEDITYDSADEDWQHEFEEDGDDDYNNSVIRNTHLRITEKPEYEEEDTMEMQMMDQNLDVPQHVVTEEDLS